MLLSISVAHETTLASIVRDTSRSMLGGPKTGNRASNDRTGRPLRNYKTSSRTISPSWCETSGFWHMRRTTSVSSLVVSFGWSSFPTDGIGSNASYVTTPVV